MNLLINRNVNSTTKLPYVKNLRARKNLKTDSKSAKQGNASTVQAV